MRVSLLFVTLLAGCIGFNSRNPTRTTSAPEETDATEGSAREARSSLQLVWRTIGWSHLGRPLRVTRVGHGPRKVLWIGRIHGDEGEGSVSTAELPRALRELTGAADEVTLVILEDANPDGSARNTRGNARGFDLNRNYPAANFKPSRFFGFRPLDQPEARALHDLVQRERPDLVIVAHSWRGDHFINYDGPAGHLAERFSALSGYRVKVSSDIAPTPGSLGSWIGGTLGIPILTLEYQRGREPWAAWNETKDAILSVVRTG